jgi:ribosomal protein S2
MRKSEIFVCEDCGMELQVVKECKEVGIPVEECVCHTEENPCSIECCGKPLVKKES